jgi:hypothetical protein
MNLSKENHNSLKVNEIKVGDIAPTKFGIELMADAIQEQVNDGLLDPLEVAIKFNSLEQLVKSVKSRITENVLAELMKHPKGKAEVLGASVSQMDSVKYDFSDLPGWSELEEQIIALRLQQKEIEDVEKEYHKGDLPIKSVTSTFKIQLSK